jgi:hypothetical protein
MVQLIDRHGPELVIATMDRLVPEQSADLVVSTAHKAKGREWPTVRIAADFREPKGEPASLARPEAMLAYVAVTRARQTLDNDGLAWLDRYLADRSSITITNDTPGPASTADDQGPAVGAGAPTPRTLPTGRRPSPTTGRPRRRWRPARSSRRWSAPGPLSASTTPSFPRRWSSSAPGRRPGGAWSSWATSPPAAGTCPPTRPTATRSWSPARACAAAQPTCSTPCCTRPPTAWPTPEASRTPAGRAAGTTSATPPSPARSPSRSPPTRRRGCRRPS